MATEIIYTLAPSGGDFTTFTTAVASIDAEGKDWVTLDEQPVIEYETQVTYTDGFNYINEKFDTAIANTDADHALIIRPKAGNDWGDGQPLSGLRVGGNYGADGVLNISGYCKAYALELYNTNLSGLGIDEGPTECQFFRGVSLRVWDSQYRGIVPIDTDAEFIGCVVIDARVTGFRYASKYYNCTSVSNQYGCFPNVSPALYPECVNFVAYANTDNFNNTGQYTAGSSNNASSTQSTQGVPGTTPLAQNVVAGDFEDAGAARDYRPSACSPLGDAGVDLSGTFGADWLDVSGTPFDPVITPIGAYAYEPTESIFTTQTPVTTGLADGDYELGMKFQSSVAGEIHGIRWWKDAAESGTHTGRIWSAGGTQLASVVFENETASGWQGQLLDSPLPILANTTYVVSVNNVNFYVATSAGLATSIVNGNLSSVDDDQNGVFNTTPGLFPNSHFNEGNYFRDVYFVADAGAGSTLAPDALSQSQTFDAGSVGTLTALAPAELNQSHTFDAGSLNAGVDIQPNPLDQSQTFDAGVLSTDTAIQPAALDHAQTIDAGSVTTGTTLQPNALDHAQTLDEGSIGTLTALSPNALDHAQKIDAGALLVGTTIQPSALDHAQTFDQGSVGTLTALLGDPMDHAQTFDQGILGSLTSIQPDELGQGQTFDAGTITTGTALSGVELQQSQTIDATTLTINNLMPLELQQIQIFDSAILEGGIALFSINARYSVDSSRYVYLIR